jgi:hypothetical protein
MEGQLLKAARQMLEDWAVGSQTRKIDEWLHAKAQLSDRRMGVVVAFVTRRIVRMQPFDPCTRVLSE